MGGIRDRAKMHLDVHGSRFRFLVSNILRKTSSVLKVASRRRRIYVKSCDVIWRSLRLKVRLIRSGLFSGNCSTSLESSRIGRPW